MCQLQKAIYWPDFEEKSVWVKGRDSFSGDGSDDNMCSCATEVREEMTRARVVLPDAPSPFFTNYLSCVGLLARRASILHRFPFTQS